jgi:MoaA/NifB/PqqE/SkfB family radical SAM enzyme
VLFIKNIIKILINVFNRNIYRGAALYRRLAGRKLKSRYYADMVTTKINQLVGNDFIPNPKTFLHIEPSNICNLKCRFCAYRKAKNKKAIMSNELFFNIVNKATDFGFEHLGLTPVTGEVFVDKNFIEKLEFLENHRKVKKYFFFTNFVLANQDIIDWLINSKKLYKFFISLYGHDKESFFNITGSNEISYNKLISNLNYLLKRCKDIKFKLEFGLRTSRSFESLENCKSDLCQILNAIQKISKKKIMISKSFNTWGGYITQEDVKDLDMIINDASYIYKRGACSLLIYKNEVLVDGRVNACACRDVNATMSIGDLKTQSFEEIYSIKNKKYINLIKNQQKGFYSQICKECDFYRSIYKNYAVYKDLEKKNISLKNFYKYLSTC